MKRVYIFFELFGLFALGVLLFSFGDISGSSTSELTSYAVTNVEAAPDAKLHSTGLFLLIIGAILGTLTLILRMMGYNPYSDSLKTVFSHLQRKHDDESLDRILKKANTSKTHINRVLKH